MEYSAEIVVIGGGVGGCGAALAACKAGRKVILTEETAWIGGQFTNQAVPPDEHGWIEEFGCTASYRKFRSQVRQYYRDYYPLREEFRRLEKLNPGNGWVSPLCHEPRVALAVLEAMLAPFVSSKRLMILRNARPVAVELETPETIRSVQLQSTIDGQSFTLKGQFFLDATENGDLLPLSSTEHVTGSESRLETGEPSAKEIADVHNVQAFSVCFVLEHLAAADNTISEPENYHHWKNYVPALDPAWPGPLLSWTGLNPRTMQKMVYNFDPHNEKPALFSGLWAFRRIIDRAQFAEGFYPSDLCLVNWPMIDYMEGDLLTCGEEERSKHITSARQLSLSMLYWLQTEAPRPDGGFGWPGLRLRGNITGSGDGLAMSPYIREARRIRALTTITEQDISATLRPNDCLAERYEDSVGIGYYRIDLHPSSGGDNYVDVASLPFRIPLGALIPRRVRNILPAAKNIGTTHISNGCYRLHPVEWNIGEVAGYFSAFCLESVKDPQKIHNDSDAITKFQRRLQVSGIELTWPENLLLDDGDPHAHAR